MAKNETDINDNKNDGYWIVADNENKRKVNYKDALDFCERNGNMMFFQTSAKDSTNVNEAFNNLARQAVEAQKEASERSTAKY